MKRLMFPAVLVLVVALGSYNIFAQQSSMSHEGSDAMMSDGTMGGGMSGGMMEGMSCCCCAKSHVAVAATNDGGVIVATGGKLIKYDAALKKVSAVDIDVEGDAANPQMPQDCSMMQMMK